MEDVAHDLSESVKECDSQLKSSAPDTACLPSDTVLEVPTAVTTMDHSETLRKEDDQKSQKTNECDLDLSMMENEDPVLVPFLSSPWLTPLLTSNTSSRWEEGKRELTYPPNTRLLMEWYLKSVERNSELVTFISSLYSDLLPVLTALVTPGSAKSFITPSSSVGSKILEAQVTLKSAAMSIEEKELLGQGLNLQKEAFSPSTLTTLRPFQNGSSLSHGTKSPDVVVPASSSSRLPSTSAAGVTKGKVVSGSIVKASRSLPNGGDSVLHPPAAVVKGTVKVLEAAQNSGGSTVAEAKTLRTPVADEEKTGSPAFDEDFFRSLGAESLTLVQELLHQTKVELVAAQEGCERRDIFLEHLRKERDLERQRCEQLLSYIVQRLSTNCFSENGDAPDTQPERVLEKVSENVFQSVHLREINANLHSQVESMQYAYAHLKGENRSNEEELRLLREKVAHFEGQLMRVTAMRVEQASLTPVNPPFGDTNALEKRLSTLQESLKMTKKQIKDASALRENLENVVSTLQQERRVLQQSLRAAQRQVEEYELEAAERGSATTLEKSLQKREMQLLQLQRTFQERISRHEINLAEWTDREEVYRKVVRHLQRRNDSLVQQQMILMEKNRRELADLPSNTAEAETAHEQLPLMKEKGLDGVFSQSHFEDVSDDGGKKMLKSVERNTPTLSLSAASSKLSSAITNQRLMPDQSRAADAVAEPSSNHGAQNSGESSWETEKRQLEQQLAVEKEKHSAQIRQQSILIQELRRALSDLQKGAKKEENSVKEQTATVSLSLHQTPGDQSPRVSDLRVPIASVASPFVSEGGAVTSSVSREDSSSQLFGDQNWSPLTTSSGGRHEKHTSPQKPSLLVQFRNMEAKYRAALSELTKLRGEVALVKKNAPASVSGVSSQESDVKAVQLLLNETLREKLELEERLANLQQQ